MRVTRNGRFAARSRTWPRTSLTRPLRQCWRSLSLITTHESGRPPNKLSFDDVIRGTRARWGKQHEERINSTLDDIEARFGSKGRDAVKRAAEQIANTFARELYHEVIRLLSPLAASAQRLRAHLSAENVLPEALAEETDRIGRRVAQLRAVLDAMRAYTAQPALTFQSEVLQEVVREAASVAVEGNTGTRRRPAIEIDVPPGVLLISHACVSFKLSRTSSPMPWSRIVKWRRRSQSKSWPMSRRD